MLGKLLKKALTLNNLFLISLTLLGISHMTTQLIVIRELFNVFEGNEMISGIVLFSWLFTMSLGSFFGKFLKIRKKLVCFLLLQAVVVLFPFIQIFLIRYLRRIFLPGIVLNINTVFLLSLLLILPFCFISGILLILACSILGKKKIGIVYALDNIGDIIGSFIFSFVLIHFLSHYQIAILVAICNLIVILTMLSKTKYKIIPLFFIILTIILLFSRLDEKTLSFEYPNQKIVYWKETPFGRFVVTKYGNQLNYFENGLLLFSTNQTQEKEETIHYALSQLRNVKNVLLISGGISSTIKEIKKYKPEEIDYVEIDPCIIQYGIKNGLTHNAKTFLSDGRKFVENINKKYDAIIVDISFPSSAQLNRFFTIQFFKEVKKKLRKNGVFSISLISSENYLSKNLANLHSSIYFALKKVFKNVLLVPGETVYFVASDSNLTKKIDERLKEKNISTSYVQFYSQAKLTKERIYSYLSQLNKNFPLNDDLRPIAYFLAIESWLEKFHFDIKTFEILIFSIFLTLTILYVLRKHYISFAIFTTGFVAISLQNIIIILFQIFHGYVYQEMGILIASFMLGLSISSTIFTKVKGNFKIFLFIEFLLTIFCLLFSLLVKMKISETLFYLLSFLSALFVGSEFAIASKLIKKRKEETASILYTSDLLGSSIGSLISILFLIPILGIKDSLFSLVFINSISLILLIMSKL